MLTEQKRIHGLGKSGPKSEINSDEEFNSRVSLKGAGIDNKLSMRAQRIGGIGEQAFEAMVESPVPPRLAQDRQLLERQHNFGRQGESQPSVRYIQQFLLFEWICHLGG